MVNETRRVLVDTSILNHDHDILTVSRRSLQRVVRRAPGTHHHVLTIKSSSYRAHSADGSYTAASSCEQYASYIVRVPASEIYTLMSLMIIIWYICKIHIYIIYLIGCLMTSRPYNVNSCLNLTLFVKTDEILINN